MSHPGASHTFDGSSGLKGQLFTAKPKGHENQRSTVIYQTLPYAAVVFVGVSGRYKIVKTTKFPLVTGVHVLRIYSLIFFYLDNSYHITITYITMQTDKWGVVRIETYEFCPGKGGHHSK